MASSSQAWNYNIDFIGRMRPILWISAILTVASLAALATWGLNLGTDFAGGYEIQVHFPRHVSETEIRAILAPMALDDARVQRFGAEGDDDYLILVRGAAQVPGSQLTQARLEEGLATVADSAHALVGTHVADNAEELVLTFAAPVDEAKLREALAKINIAAKTVTLQTRAGADGAQAEAATYTVTRPGLADDVAACLRHGLGLGEDIDPVVRVEFVGPQVGAQLRNQGILAVAYALLLIFVYVAIRFDMFFSPGAILATLHDVVLTLGFFSVFQIDFNLTVVAAVLTLIGFSLNDTIVVYDRIRENAARLRGSPLRPLVNQSINETLSRTILTSGTVLMVTLALLVLGGPFIRGLSIMMFVGVVVGTYSSIAVASPLYIVFREYADRQARPRHARHPVS